MELNDLLLDDPEGMADPDAFARQLRALGLPLKEGGDYYGFRDTGIVIRNGVAFRDAGARQGLAFYADGS